MGNKTDSVTVCPAQIPQRQTQDSTKVSTVQRRQLIQNRRQGTALSSSIPQMLGVVVHDQLLQISNQKLATSQIYFEEKRIYTKRAYTRLHINNVNSYL
jgi:hypothetical protein